MYLRLREYLEKLLQSEIFKAFLVLTFLPTSVNFTLLDVVSNTLSARVQIEEFQFTDSHFLRYLENIWK